MISSSRHNDDVYLADGIATIKIQGGLPVFMSVVLINYTIMYH